MRSSYSPQSYALSAQAARAARTAQAAAFRKLALFPMAGPGTGPGSGYGARSVGGPLSGLPVFIAAGANGAYANVVQGLLPLPGGHGSRPLALNAPLWALVSLFTAFSLLWAATVGPMVGLEVAGTPLAVVSDGAASVGQLLRRTAASFPAAQSVVLARLRPGAGAGQWTLVEVDGKVVRVSDPARVEAALASAGFTLESGDRLVTVPNTGRQLVQRALPFSLVDGGVPFSHRVAADTVGEALRSVGVDVDTADLVQPPLESNLVPGLRISILRAQPVTIAAPDVSLETRTRAASVAELLAERSVALGPLDRVEPALEAPVPAFGTVQVVRVREEERSETRLMPFQTRTQLDDGLVPGARYRLRTGVAGLVERVIKVVFENDAEVRRVPVLERILREPVDEVVLTGKPVLPSLPLLPIPSSVGAATIPGAPDVPVRSVMTMVATAYEPGPASTGKYPGHPAYGITATGMRAAYGTVAVDPRVIPFFTRMYITGYGYGVAADTGGDIRGNRIDVFFPTYAEAIRWGRRTVQVYLLE